MNTELVHELQTDQRSFFFFWGGNLERKILSFAQILLGLLFIHEPYEHSERQQFAVGVHLCLPFFGISCCCHSALTAMPLSFGLIVRWHLFSSFVSCVSCPCMFRLCPFICLAALLAEVVLDLWPFLPSALLFLCFSLHLRPDLGGVSALEYFG